MRKYHSERHAIVYALLAVGLTIIALSLEYSLWSSPGSSSTLVVSAAMLASSPSPTSSPTLPPTATVLADQGNPTQQTPPTNAVDLTLTPDPNRVGWIASKEPAPHWGDPNLYAGTYQDQTYASILQFDVGGFMPPGSKVVSAALELTGLNASNLGKTGKWQLELIEESQAKSWNQTSPNDILKTPALTIVGQPVSAGELGVTSVNRFEFSQEQTQQLQQQLEFGRVTFRITGPTESGDNLFSWASGAGVARDPASPRLYLGGVPGPFTIITNTPTPANVFTAAAYVSQATREATETGTPTPLGLGVVTATPGGERIEVAAIDTPENAATAQAISAYATAVALTTGTFTPTPKNWVVVTPTFTSLPPPSPKHTPTPVFVPIAKITVAPTPTQIALADPLTLPIPSFLKGKILALTQRYGPEFANLPIVFGPDGKVEGLLTGDLYYNAATARQAYSPDRQKLVYVAPGVIDDGRLQIWVQDLRTGEKSQLTHVSRGIAYDPVWSPDGRTVAYVSGETGNDEIFVYDTLNGPARRLTITTEPGIYNQHPSWSPDGTQIVFKSNRDSAVFQIRIMSADGSGQRILNESRYEEIDPVWVWP